MNNWAYISGVIEFENTVDFDALPREQYLEVNLLNNIICLHGSLKNKNFKKAIKFLKQFTSQIEVKSLLIRVSDEVQEIVIQTMEDFEILP